MIITLPPSPDNLWIELGSKPKWLPMILNTGVSLGEMSYSFPFIQPQPTLPPFTLYFLTAINSLMAAIKSVASVQGDS